MAAGMAQLMLCPFFMHACRESFTCAAMTTLFFKNNNNLFFNHTLQIQMGIQIKNRKYQSHTLGKPLFNQHHLLLLNRTEQMGPVHLPRGGSWLKGIWGHIMGRKAASRPHRRTLARRQELEGIVPGQSGGQVEEERGRRRFLDDWSGAV